MMKRLQWLTLATLALSPLTTAFQPATAGTLFSRAEVDQTKFAVVASPYAGGTAHQLLVIEQLSSARRCWSERAGSPTLINPLLTEFDFTGICGRSIDSNGYSIRMADQDLGWRYSLRVTQRNGDLVLLGVPTDRRSPELEIGRANGSSSGFVKLTLNPGWRLTKRVYNGQTMGHVYLTNDQPLNSAIASNSPAPSSSVLKPTTAVSQPVPGVAKPILTLPKPAAPTKSPATISIAVPRPESQSGVNSGGANASSKSGTIAVSGQPLLPPPPAAPPKTGKAPQTGATAATTLPPSSYPSTPAPVGNPGNFVVPTVTVYP